MDPRDDAVVSLVDFDTPDPYLVLKPNGGCFLTFTCGDRIDLIAASSLITLRANRFFRRTLWTPVPGSPCSADLWAPELHQLDGRWYVYFTAANPFIGPTSRRLYVLGGPSAYAHPFLGDWTLLGPVLGLPPLQWAIDATVASFADKRYLVYSGWPLGDLTGDLVQQLFLARLASPTRVDSQSICISAPGHSWEFSRDGRGSHGINEGPQFLSSPDGSWVGLLFSCAGSWTSDYKMSTLQFMGGDPLDVRSWRKATQPLLHADPLRPRGLYGPGHGCAVRVGSNTLCVFHATESPSDGWSHRQARAQRIVWTENGPSMGECIGHLANDLDSLTKFHPPSDAPRGVEDDRFRASAQSSSDSAALSLGNSYTA